MSLRRLAILALTAVTAGLGGCSQEDPGLLSQQPSSISQVSVPTVQPDFPVSTADRDQVRPSVASDGTGFLVVWEDTRNFESTGNDIFGTLLKPDSDVDPADDSHSRTFPRPPGPCISPTFPLTSGPDLAPIVDPDCIISTLGAGGQAIFIVINNHGNVPAQPSLTVTDNIVVGVKGTFTIGAHPGTGTLTVNDPTGCLPPLPALDSSATIQVNYTPPPNPPEEITITATTAILWTAQNACNVPISTAPGNQFKPAVAFDGTHYLVVWEDNRSQTTTETDIFGALVAPDGTIITPDIAISTSDGGQFAPRVAFDGTDYVVVWSDTRSSVLSDIFMALVSPAGDVLDPSRVPVSVSAGSQTSPAVACDAAGGTGCLVAWEDAGTGSAPPFDLPEGITTDGTDLYIVDSRSHVIKRFEMTTGRTTVLAGRAGSPGSADGVGDAACFRLPKGITFATVGSVPTLFVADSGNHTIRAVVIAAGEVTTVAGTAGVPCNPNIASCDGTGAAALFNSPSGIATDGTDLYVADTSDHTIRQIVIGSGVVTTLAGAAGLQGSADGTGAAARFRTPEGLTLSGGNLYVADTGNHIIRQVVIGTGVVTTLAGTRESTAAKGLIGCPGSADGTGAFTTGACPADPTVSAGGAPRFNFPSAVTTDGTNLYVADTDNHTIRQIVIGTGVTTTLAGTAGVAGQVDGSGAAALFNSPKGLVVVGGDLYVADTKNHVLRKIEISSATVSTPPGLSETHMVGSLITASGCVVPPCVTPPNGFAISTAAGNQTKPSLAFDPGDLATGRQPAYLVVWEDTRNFVIPFIIPTSYQNSGTLNVKVDATLSDGGAGGTFINAATGSSAAGSLTITDIVGTLAPDATATAYGMARGFQYRPPDSFSGDITLTLIVSANGGEGTCAPDSHPADNSNSMVVSVTQSGMTASSTHTTVSGHTACDLDVTNPGLGLMDISVRAHDLFGARVSSAGGLLDPGGFAVMAGSGDHLAPSITFDGLNYLIVWEDTRNSFLPDIFGTRVTPAGAVLDPGGFEVSTAPDAQAAPSLAFGGSVFLAAWGDWRNFSVSGGPDIFGSLISP